MGLHVMHRSGWGGGHDYGHTAFTLPAPLAFFGMAIALMFGTTLGMLFGKKSMMMGGMGGMGGMKMAHHHHGWGMPGCAEKHVGHHRREEGSGAREERDEGE